MRAVTVIRSAAVPATDLLFCYGTLMTGFSRRHLLDPATLEGEARVRGALYDFGEYPGLVLDGPGGDAGDAGADHRSRTGADAPGWVVGELYRVRDLAGRLPILDAEEWYDPANPAGSLYVRRQVPVMTDGGPREAWAYLYNPAVGGPPERGP